MAGFVSLEVTTKCNIEFSFTSRICFYIFVFIRKFVIICNPLVIRVSGEILVVELHQYIIVIIIIITIIMHISPVN